MTLRKNEYKTRRTLVLIVLAAAAVICMAGSGAAADGGPCGDGLTWSVDEDNKFIITYDGTGTGVMTDYSKENPAPWDGTTYEKCFASVTLPEGLNNIGEYAFAGRGINGTLKIPSTVKKIGKNAFASCFNLSEIELGNGVESIEERAFSDCDDLTKINFGTGLKSIGLKAFESCDSLEEHIQIPAGVTSIDPQSFYCCILLTGIDVNNDNTAYKSVDGVLFTKNGDKLVICPGGISGTAYTIPEGVTSIGDCAFQYCMNLESISLPDSIRSIGKNGFDSCYNVMEISLPAEVEEIGENAFFHCNSLTSIHVDETNPYFEDKDGVLYSKDGKKILWYPAGRMEESYVISEGVEEIGTAAFSNCTYLKNITIPDSVAAIDARAFIGCGNLSAVVIPSGMKTIGDFAFKWCSLKNIVFPSGVKSIGDEAFCGDCDEYLRSINIPASVTSIGNMAFGKYNRRANAGSVIYTKGDIHLLDSAYSKDITAIAKVNDDGSYTFTSAITFTLDDTNAPVESGNKFYGWKTADGKIVTEITPGTTTLIPIREKPSPSAKSKSTVTAFSGTKDNDSFTFNRSAVVTKAVLPGASSARITAGTGDGWYKFDMVAPGFTGNGTMTFQVPLDVLQIKGYSTGDVGLYHQENGEWILKTTTLINTDNQYAHYKAAIDSCSPFKIDFAKGVTTSATTTETKTSDTGTESNLSISGVSSSVAGSTIVLKAVCTDGHQHTYSWNVSNPAVATIDTNGNMNLLKEGRVTVTVTDEDGHSATKEITIAAKENTTKKTETTTSPAGIMSVLAGLGAAAILRRRK